MLFMSLLLSAALIGLSIVAAARAKDPNRTYWRCLFGVLFGVIPCFVMFPVYLYHAFALGLFASLCSALHLRRSIFVLGSLGIFAAVYLAVLVPAWNTVQEAVRLYPRESLADRLAYEGPAYANAGLPIPKPPDTETVWQSQRMSEHNSYRRFYALQALHGNTTDLFVNAAGFGVGRMMPTGPKEIFSAEPIRLAQRIAVPEPSQCGYEPPVTTEDSILAEKPSSSGEGLESLLDSSRADFLNPLGFGYVRDLRNVTGFLSHRFTKYPAYSDRATAGSWRLDALDLISSLKHKEPVAYVSKNLPRMDELREALTRPLDEFERERLPVLQSGEELSAAQGPRRIRMLGAIRAQEICLNCHTANKDDLLGAFSYDLRLDLPTSANR
jgi:hypothetical protein